MDYKQELIKRANTPLSKGEMLLLAKVIADKLPISTSMDFDPDQFVILYKASISNIMFSFNEYTYVSNTDVDYVCKLITSFVKWRHQVAIGDYQSTFLLGTEYIVDELSGMLKHVDMASVCEVVNDYSNANYLTVLFKEMVTDLGLKKNG